MHHYDECMVKPKSVHLCAKMRCAATAFVLVLVFGAAVDISVAQDLPGTSSQSKPVLTHRVLVPAAMHEAKMLPQVLSVGLQWRYDFAGWIRGSEYQNVNGYDAGTFTAQISDDVLRIDWNRIYTVNPRGWPNDSWSSFYSKSQLRWLSRTPPADPAWKWGAPVQMPLDWSLQPGGTFVIDGQLFGVSGPHDGYTAFGVPYRYWELVNVAPILMRSGSNGWAQVVEPGEAILRYDAGHRRIRTYSSVRRTYYHYGQRTSDTVQYIEQLTQYSGWGSVVSSRTNDVAAAETSATSTDPSLSPDQALPVR